MRETVWSNSVQKLSITSGLWDLFAIRFKYSLTQHSRLMIIIYFIWKCFTPKGTHRQCVFLCVCVCESMCTVCTILGNELVQSARSQEQMRINAMYTHKCADAQMIVNLLASIKYSQMKTKRNGFWNERREGLQTSTETMVQNSCHVVHSVFSLSLVVSFVFGLVCSVFCINCLFIWVSYWRSLAAEGENERNEHGNTVKSEERGNGRTKYH